MGRDDLMADTRYATVDSRLADVDALEAEVVAWTAPRTTREIEETLAAAGVPCSAVASMADVVASPQLRAREMFIELTGTYVGTALLTGIPVKLDSTPGSIRRPPPRAGADTERILAGLVGLDEATIAALRASGAI